MALALLPGLIAAIPAGATGDALGGLAAERAALQSQAQQLLGDRRHSLAQLLQTQDRIADLRRQLGRNSAALADLEHQQSELRARINVTADHIRIDQAILSDVARGQYKTNGASGTFQAVFGSQSFGEMVTHIVASEALVNRAHALVLKLRDTERSLAAESDTLRAKQAEVGRVQDQLAAQKAEVAALAAEQKARFNSIDAAARKLLARIDEIDAAIMAATRPPGGRTIPSRQEVIRIIRAAAASYRVSGDQLVRVADCESHLNPRAYDARSGASGLFQFMPGTFYAHGGHDIWDATDQSNVAAKMFSQGYGDSWSCR